MSQPAIPSADATARRWDASDLDRCEHGRHSIDPCASCPGGQSSGNLCITALARGHFVDLLRMDDQGFVLVRIGTTLGGEPILIRPNRRSW